MGLVGIGAIAGWLTGFLLRNNGFGLLVNILVGITGSVIGALVFGAKVATLGYDGTNTLIVGFISGVLLLYVSHAVSLRWGRA